MLQRIITALGTLHVRGLVTLGPAMAGERFDVPANVVAVPSAPHARVFPHAAAVVTHAGHGTVMRALVHGVPLLCLPMGRDQDDNAARVFARGVGLRLRPSAKPPRIAAAIQRLLDEPGFRVQAERLGRIIARRCRRGPRGDGTGGGRAAIGLRRRRETDGVHLPQGFLGEVARNRAGGGAAGRRSSCTIPVHLPQQLWGRLRGIEREGAWPGTLSSRPQFSPSPAQFAGEGVGG